MVAPRLIDRLRTWAARDGAAPAVMDAEGQWSYAELLVRAEAGAAALRREGVAAGDVAPIALPPSREAIAALFASHAAGAGFYFADAARSSDTHARLLADLAVARDTDLAYAVASSGSSGRAKAVRVGHGGLLAMLDAQIAAFGLGPGKRALLGTPLCFDASISDVGTAIASGATLCIPPRRDDPRGLVAFLRDAGVTHADLPPAMLGLIDAPPGCLECVIVGGEVVPAATLRRWAARTRVVVSYGPSEATVCTSLIEVDAARWEAPSIGLPLPHVRYRIGDQRGELWIGGPGLALGYANEPELERERFVMEDGERWFRTGDRVRRAQNGEWIFLGRLDRQRKIGGRLVCPEEIEAALAACGAADAAVVVRAVNRSGLPPRTTAVAFVAGIDGAALPALRAALALRMPLGMVPRIELVARLPRTPSGKPDLVAMEREVLRGGGDPTTASGAAGVVARSMARVLGLAHVAEDDDFRALGGDSLAAIELVADAAHEGIVIAPDAVLDARTPRALALRARVTAAATTVPTAAILHHLEPFRAELARVPRGDRGSGEDAFFTGASGFFGSRVVSAWLARGAGRALCLVRAPSAAAASTRLAEVWARSGLPASDLSRIEAIAGDAAELCLGLSATEFDGLARRVSVVIHAAASLAVTRSFSDLFGDNVASTLEAARLALAGGAALHLVSTLAVLLGGLGCPETVDEQTPRTAIDALHGGYAASKWAAEALLDGLVDAHVHRLGLLGGDTHTAAPSTGLFAAVVRGLAALGMAPEGPHEALRFDLTPVDIAADSVAAIVRTTLDTRRIWHISSSRGASLADLLAALAAEDRPIEIVPAERFAAAARANLTVDAARTLLALRDNMTGERRRADLDLFLLSGRRLRSAVAVDEPTPDALRRQVRRVLETDSDA